MNTLQQLHDSRINWDICSVWAHDEGFSWFLGDDLNGFSDSGDAKTLEEAIAALAEAAREHFPDSVFAKETPGSTTCSTCIDGDCGDILCSR